LSENWYFIVVAATMLAAGDPDETPKEASRSNWPIRRRIGPSAEIGQFGGRLPANWPIRQIDEFDLTDHPHLKFDEAQLRRDCVGRCGSSPTVSPTPSMIKSGSLNRHR